MKTVPTVHAAAQADTINFSDLPDELRVALADVAGAAREGLLAMSVATGLAVMQAMFEAEITAVAGPKGRHDPDRVAVRHGTGKGSVTLGGRRVPVDRPRARSVDGHEVPLQTYGHFAADDQLSAVVLERMLAGVATRRHARVAEPVGEQVETTARSTSRSAVSRRFVRETETALAELLARDLTDLDIKVLMLDGEHLNDRCVVVALAIGADGTKVPIGLWDGSTENKTVVRSLLADLVERGLNVDDGLLVVIDGAKALAAGVREVFGSIALVQRCTSALAPKTSRTPAASALAPSMTTSSPSSTFRPRSTRSASSERTTVLFSVEPSHSPIGTLVPSAPMASATTTQRSLRCSPSSISTLMSRSVRSRASNSASAVSVSRTNRRETADLLVDLAVVSTCSPTGSATRACRRVATPASIRSSTTALSWSSAAKCP